MDVSQAGAGWECQASVTVRTHSRGAFSFSFGGLRLCVFFLLEEMRGQEGITDLGSSWPHPIPLPCTG